VERRKEEVLAGDASGAVEYPKGDLLEEVR
jgi:hypothetical protein